MFQRPAPLRLPYAGKRGAAMMTVGQDSYVSVGEAGGYIAEHYTPGDAQRAAWEALSDADREVYLKNAAAAIERHCCPGKKYGGRNQFLSFPRAASDAWPARRQASADDSGRRAEFCAVPDEIRHAQIEEALELCSPGKSTQAQQARRGAVGSYSVGQLSETLRGGAKSGLMSEKAEALLLPCLSGGYHVC